MVQIGEGMTELHNTEYDHAKTEVYLAGQCYTKILCEIYGAKAVEEAYFTEDTIYFQNKYNDETKSSEMDLAPYELSFNTFNNIQMALDMINKCRGEGESKGQYLKNADLCTYLSESLVGLKEMYEAYTGKIWEDNINLKLYYDYLMNTNSMNLNLEDGETIENIIVSYLNEDSKSNLDEPIIVLAKDGGYQTFHDNGDGNITIITQPDKEVSLSSLQQKNSKTK